MLVFSIIVSLEGNLHLPHLLKLWLRTNFQKSATHESIKILRGSMQLTFAKLLEIV